MRSVIALILVFTVSARAEINSRIVLPLRISTDASFPLPAPVNEGPICLFILGCHGGRFAVLNFEPGWTRIQAPQAMITPSALVYAEGWKWYWHERIDKPISLQLRLEWLSDGSINPVVEPRSVCASLGDQTRCIEPAPSLGGGGLATQFQQWFRPRVRGGDWKVESKGMAFTGSPILFLPSANAARAVVATTLSATLAIEAYDKDYLPKQGRPIRGPQFALVEGLVTDSDSHLELPIHLSFDYLSRVLTDRLTQFRFKVASLGDAHITKVYVAFVKGRVAIQVDATLPAVLGSKPSSGRVTLAARVEQDRQDESAYTIRAVDFGDLRINGFDGATGALLRLFTPAIRNAIESNAIWSFAQIIGAARQSLQQGIGCLTSTNVGQLVFVDDPVLAELTADDAGFNAVARSTFRIEPVDVVLPFAPGAGCAD